MPNTPKDEEWVFGTLFKIKLHAVIRKTQTVFFCHMTRKALDNIVMVGNISGKIQA